MTKVTISNSPLQAALKLKVQMVAQQLTIKVVATLEVVMQPLVIGSTSRLQILRGEDSVAEVEIEK